MDQTQLIITMYKNNVSIYKIAKIIGTTELKIYECIKANGFSHFVDPRYERNQAICQKYNDGKSIMDIVNELKLERHLVADVLRKEGIYKNRFAKYDTPEKTERNNKIIKLYQEGNSLNKVSEMVGLSPSSIAKILHALNVDTRPQHMKGHSKGTTKNRKYCFDINYFETIDTEEKAYWLGFIYADGHVAYRGLTTIALQERDKEHLEKLRKALGDENVKLKYNKRTKSYAIWFSSVKMAEDLLKLGCMQNKSLQLVFPTEQQVPSKYITAFMRGYFDGDGCITTNDIATFSLLGTPEFLDGYEEKLLQLADINKKNKRIHRDFWNDQTEEIAYSGKEKIEKIYNFLYKDATIFLDRKKEKFDDYIRRLRTKSQES